MSVIQDAYRFVLWHKEMIETAPLQVYASALIFSPTNSLTRKVFSDEETRWINLKPKVEADWDACLQTLKGHESSITSVVFSATASDWHLTQMRRQSILWKRLQAMVPPFYGKRYSRYILAFNQIQEIS